MKNIFNKEWFGNLTHEEVSELISLEYVLTWGYTDNTKVDEERYIYLSKISWETSTIKQNL